MRVTTACGCENEAVADGSSRGPLDAVEGASRLIPPIIGDGGYSREILYIWLQESKLNTVYMLDCLYSK